MAALFEACRVDRLTTFEVHNLAAFDNAFRIPTRHIESAELFAAHFTQLPGDVELVAVSPMPAAPSVRNPFAGRWSGISGARLAVPTWRSTAATT